MEMGGLPVVHRVAVAVAVVVAVARQRLRARRVVHVALLRPGPHGWWLGGVMLHGGHGPRWGSWAGALGPACCCCCCCCHGSLLLIGTTAGATTQTTA